jgi:hypothetical protein
LISVAQEAGATLPPSTYPEQTMTTLTTPAVFIDPRTDFVSTDNAALASHMSNCASKRSRFFSLHAALELAHSVVFSRMVTAAVFAVVLLAVTGIV